MTLSAARSTCRHSLSAPLAHALILSALRSPPDTLPALLQAEPVSAGVVELLPLAFYRLHPDGRVDWERGLDLEQIPAMLPQLFTRQGGRWCSAGRFQVSFFSADFERSLALSLRFGEVDAASDVQFRDLPFPFPEQVEISAARRSELLTANDRNAPLV